MKQLTKVTSWALASALLALICYSLYNIFLISEFKLNLNYIQWLSIIIIFQCIIPTGIKQNAENTSGKSNTSKNGFVNDFINYKNLK